MFFRNVAAIVIVLIAPIASAHNDPTETTYDPLSLDLIGFPSGSGTIEASPPAPAARYFPAQTPADGAPGHLDFALQAPVAFSAPNGMAVRLHIVADKPTLGSDTASSSFVVRLLLEEKELAGTRRTVGFPPQSLATPGSSQDIAVVIPAPGVAVAKGAMLTLRIEPQMPYVADAALKIEVGEASGSRADFPGARVPTIADLDLAEPSGATQFLLANGSFVPPEPGASLVVVSVKHNDTALLSKATGAITYVVLRGDESVVEGRAFHEFPAKEARDAAAHLYRVGAQRVRVHPGIGVVVRLNLTASTVVDIACESHCPTGGWKTTLAPPSAGAGTGTSDATGSEPTNVLIPPPRATSGIPVSKDAPEEKKTSGAGIVADLGVLLGFALAARRFVKQRL